MKTIDSFIVIKRTEVEETLSSSEQAKFFDLVDKIRNKYNYDDFYLIRKEEPYIGKVIEVVCEGEKQKEIDNKYYKG